MAFHDKSLLVHALRTRLGMSQSEFAQRIGVSHATANRWEKGHCEPSRLAMLAMKALVAELGKDGQDLMEAYYQSQQENSNGTEEGSGSEDCLR